MKKIAFYFLAIACFSYLFVNCEKEEVYNSDFPSNQESKYIYKILSISEIPEVESFISRTTGDDIFIKTTTEKDQPLFDVDNVTQVIDSTNFSNYSFKFIFADTPLGTFYNLIVGRDRDGNFTTPYILKYVYDANHLDEFLKDERNFKGKITLHKYTDFLNEDFFTTKQHNSRENEKSGKNPCDERDVDTSRSGSSSGSNNGSGSHGDSDGDSGRGANATISGGSTGGITTGSGSSSCSWYMESTCWCKGDVRGISHNCTPKVLVIDCNPQEKSARVTKGTPCPQPQGTIAISPEAKIIQKTNYYLDNKLTKTELQFLEENTLFSKNIHAVLLDALKSKDNKRIEQAKQWAHAQISLSTLKDDAKTKFKPKVGLVANRPNLKHTHVYSHGSQTYYKLEDGSYVISSEVPLTVKPDGSLYSTRITETFKDSFWYIQPAKIDGKEQAWSNFILPKVPRLAKELELLFKLATIEAAKAIGTYVLPVDDLKIIITGTDLNGQDANRFMAAGFLVTSVVPGSKFLKAGKVVSIIAKTEKTWAKIIKWGDKSYKLTYKVINNVVDFGDRGQLATILKTSSNIEAHHIIPWKKCTNAVVQAAARVGFHPNMVQNGIGLQKYSRLIGSGLHGNHPAYDNFVLHRLNTFQRNGFSPESANTFLVNNLIPELKNLIIKAKNSNMNLNEYFKKVANPANGIPNY